MAFNDLQPNQGVSFTDAQSGGFNLKSGQSSVTSNQIVVKSEALAKYQLRPTSMDGFTDNRVVPKATWVKFDQSCVQIEALVMFDGDLNAVINIYFLKKPVTGINFTIQVTGATTGFNTSRTLNTSSFQGGVPVNTTTNSGIGSGYSQSEVLNVSMTQVFDGIYEHTFCAQTSGTAPTPGTVPTSDLPSFTFNSTWTFTDTGALANGHNGSQRSYGLAIPTGGLWSVKNSGYGLAINWENSANCSGSNNLVQSGTASASIFYPTSEQLFINWRGIAELHDSGFENMVITVDGLEVGRATSAGGKLGCTMGNIVSTNHYPAGLMMLAGNHTLSITTTTYDNLYHTNAFYEFAFSKKLIIGF